MSVVKDKYRGTTLYQHVMAELVRAAQCRGITTYPDIALIIGLPISGNYTQSEVGQVLGEISEDEVAHGRPMLSAVVVSVVNNKPSFGFYKLARQLGKLHEGENEEGFWNNELVSAYAAWRRPLPKKKGPE